MQAGQTTKLLKSGEYRLYQESKQGEGSYGKVFKGVKTSTGEVVAIKCISIEYMMRDDKGDKMVDLLKNEINLLRKTAEFKNPYLLKFYESFHTPNNIYIVTEFCNDGNLEEVMIKREEKKKTFKESEIVPILYQIVCGLHTLAINNIVHRDMKVENIFINNGIHKIGDLGFAKEVDGGYFQTKLGTGLYMAPEFYKNEPFTQKVDIWALGVMAHYMYFNDFPYKNRGQIMNDEYTVPAGSKLTPEYQDLLKGMMKTDAHDRFDINALKNHKIFDRVRLDVCKKLSINEFASFMNSGDGSTSKDEMQILEMENKAFNFYNRQILYMNIGRFYQSVTKWLINNDSKLLFTQFLLAKKALQKSSILLYSLKNKALPIQTELDIKAEMGTVELDYFTKSAIWDEMTETIECDCNEAQTEFRKIYERCKSKYNTDKNENVKRYLNNKLNQNIDAKLNELIDNLIAKYTNDADQASNDKEKANKLNFAMYIASLRSYEKSATEDTTYNIEGMMTNNKHMSWEEKKKLILKQINNKEII